MPQQPDNNNEDEMLAITLASEIAIEQAKKEGKFVPKNIWEILRKRKEQGTFHGEIETLVPKTIVNLTGGTHYFVIEDMGKRSLECTTCAVHHGCILEAHLLGHYRLEKGVLYFNDKAINKTP